MFIRKKTYETHKKCKKYKNQYVKDSYVIFVQKIKSNVSLKFVIMGGIVWDYTAYSGNSNISFLQIQIKLYLLTESN